MNLALKFNFPKPNKLTFALILVLLVHIVLLFILRNQRFIVSPQEKKPIEITIEPPKKEEAPDEDLTDEPIKLAPTNAHQVGEPNQNVTLPLPEQTPMPSPEEQSSPEEDTKQEPDTELLEEDTVDSKAEDALQEPDQTEDILPVPMPESLPEPEKKELTQPEKIEKKIDKPKKIRKKIVKRRYGGEYRPTMPGFFEKMQKAAQNSGDTLFIDGDPGVERDLLQMKLQSYLRKLPWYLTQAFNSKQVELRRLIERNKALKPIKFTLTANKKGEIVKLNLTGSTGNDEVDKLMLDIILSASPFPFIPESLKRERLQLPGTLDPYIMAQGASVIING